MVDDENSIMGNSFGGGGLSILRGGRRQRANTTGFFDDFLSPPDK